MKQFGFSLFIGVWMFALGVLVGRGASPITFDTLPIQERLHDIFMEVMAGQAEEEKPDLLFYDTLPEPVQHKVPGKKERAGEIVPGPVDRQLGNTLPDPDEVEMKVSRKFASLEDFQGTAAGPKPKPVPPEPKKERPFPAADIVKKQGLKKPAAQEPSPAPKAAVQKTTPKAPAQAPGAYTIQVAAFTSFKDAVSQMSALEEKGFPAYRTKGEKDGKTWYRVRTGSFGDYSGAKAQLEKLKQAKIDGMIIKKEDQ